MFKKVAALGVILVSQSLWAQSSGFGFDDSQATPAVAKRPQVVAPVPQQSVLPTTVPAAPDPAAPSAIEQFHCDTGSTRSTATATQMFKEILGVDLQPGTSLVEGEGYSGNQVHMKVVNSYNIKLRIVSHGADVAGSACWRQNGGRKQIVLAVVITNASMGNGAYTISVARNGRNSVFLRGSGQLGSVLNHHYDVISTR